MDRFVDYAAGGRLLKRANLAALFNGGWGIVPVAFAGGHERIWLVFQRGDGDGVSARFLCGFNLAAGRREVHRAASAATDKLDVKRAAGECVVDPAAHGKRCLNRADRGSFKRCRGRGLIGGVARFACVDRIWFAALRIDGDDVDVALAALEPRHAAVVGGERRGARAVAADHFYFKGAAGGCIGDPVFDLNRVLDAFAGLPVIGARLLRFILFRLAHHRAEGIAASRGDRYGEFRVGGAGRRGNGAAAGDEADGRAVRTANHANRERIVAILCFRPAGDGQRMRARLNGNAAFGSGGAVVAVVARTGCGQRIRADAIDRDFIFVAGDQNRRAVDRCKRQRFAGASAGDAQLERLAALCVADPIFDVNLGLVGFA